MESLFSQVSKAEELKELKEATMKDKIKNINWEKVIVYGVGLGFAASALYLLIKIAVAVGA